MIRRFLSALASVAFVVLVALAWVVALTPQP
jgi:predicted outer membrane protein